MTLLFALSLVLVGITIYRVVGVLDRHAEQQFRSLLASLEILAAAAVSNAIVLGSFIRDRGVKKRRFRYQGSVTRTSSHDRTSVTPKRNITTRDWGSDADLVDSLGMRCNPELKDEQPSMPRPAPVALPTAEQAKSLTPAPVAGWSRKVRESNGSDAIDLEKSTDVIAPLSPVPDGVPTTPRGMSFFDVGGLLGGNDSQFRPSVAGMHQYTINNPEVNPEQSTPPQPTGSHSHAVPYPSAALASTQRPRLHSVSSYSSRPESTGSHALLQDIGGLLTTSSPHQQYNTQAPRSSRDVTSTTTTITNNRDNNGLNEDEDEDENDVTLYSPASSTSAPLSAHETRRDISLVDVLRETPPQSIRGGAGSSRQAALQRMRRGSAHGEIGGMGGDNAGAADGNSDEAPAFRDVGGLLS